MKKVPLFVQRTSLQSLGIQWCRHGTGKTDIIFLPPSQIHKRRSSETVRPALFSNKSVRGRGTGGAFYHTKKHETIKLGLPEALAKVESYLYGVWAQVERQSMTDAWIQWQILRGHAVFFPWPEPSIPQAGSHAWLKGDQGKGKMLVLK